MKMRDPISLNFWQAANAARHFFSVGGGKKDLMAAVKYAATLGAKLPVAAAAAQCFEQAEANGLGDKDAISSIPVEWAVRGARR